MYAAFIDIRMRIFKESEIKCHLSESAEVDKPSMSSHIYSAENTNAIKINRLSFFFTMIIVGSMLTVSATMYGAVICLFILLIKCYDKIN